MRSLLTLLVILFFTSCMPVKPLQIVSGPNPKGFVTNNQAEGPLVLWKRSKSICSKFRPSFRMHCAYLVHFKYLIKNKRDRELVLQFRTKSPNVVLYRANLFCGKTETSYQPKKTIRKLEFSLKPRHLCLFEGKLIIMKEQTKEVQQLKIKNAVELRQLP